MEDIVKSLKEGFEEFKSTNAQAIESVKALVKETETGTKESIKAATEKADVLAKEVTAVSDRLLEAEQKLVAGIKAGNEAPKSLGVLLAESDEYKNHVSGKSDRFRMSFKGGFDVQANTITGQTGSPPANSDVLVQKDRQAGIIPGAFRRLRVKDLLPSGTTSSNAVEFTRELSFTNSAAETAEGLTKPEAALTFENYTAPIVTIAHWLKISRQIRDDAPMLAAYVNTRLRYGVELREETQLVAGNGVGQNLTGLTIAPNITAFSPTSGDNALDTINRIKYVLENADYPPTGIILNPTDWGNIERLKVGSSDDRYVIGDPRSAMGPVLWGLPVVVTPSMTSGKLLMAAFDIAYMYILRNETVVEMFEQDETNVQQNLVTIRAEKRAALGGLRPASVRFGNLTV